MNLLTCSISYDMLILYSNNIHQGDRTMATERTDFAQEALDQYSATPITPDYENVSADKLMEITETDAFTAGWEASIDHLHTVVKDLDIHGPLKAIIENILDTNRAEREIND